MVKTDKLYRGRMTGLHLGDAVFEKMPIITGGVGYLLLCFRTTDLGYLPWIILTDDITLNLTRMQACGRRQPPCDDGSRKWGIENRCRGGKEARKKPVPQWTVIALTVSRWKT